MDFKKYQIRVLDEVIDGIDVLVKRLVIAADVCENFHDLAHIGRIGGKEKLCCFSVAEDGSQRLIELVREGCRQHARGGGAVQMDDFQQPAA